MGRRNEIIAISEYYDIPMRIAKLRYENMSRKEIEEIVDWWVEKKAQEENE